VSFAGSPTPSTQSTDRIPTWFSDLSNTDAAVREQARTNLMGIARTDLEELRSLVEKNRPLAPSQAMALRDIVQQVYLATEPYEPVPDRAGFLGIPLPTTIVMDATDEPQTGVVVNERIPGFCAYRYLQNGDVILGVTEVPDKPFHSGGDLSEIIKGFKGGDTVHMLILRGGQQKEVPVKLDARPNWSQGPMVLIQPGVQPPPPQLPNVQDARRERQRKADEYWDANFAPLLDLGIL